MPLPRLSYRTPAIFNEPGIFVVLGARSFCLLPLPSKGRR